MSLLNKIDIQDGHEVKEICYREEGPMGQNRYWSYEERDATGIKIATYDYWECVSTTPPFKNTLGYRKCDLAGVEIEQIDF